MKKTNDRGFRRYARMHKLTLVVFIRAYPRNPRFFFPFAGLTICAALERNSKHCCADTRGLRRFTSVQNVIGRFKTSHLWALVAGRVMDVDNRRIRCHRQSKRGAVQVWFCGSCEFCLCFRRLDPEGALAGFESSGTACAHDSTSPAAAV